MGKTKTLLFDINKFSKFKDKIIYIAIDKPPPDLLKINDHESLDGKQSKRAINAKKEKCIR